jgi:glycosidase
MLLMSGQDLSGGTISCQYPGVRVARSYSTDGGHYLFVWLRLAPGPRPGQVPCQVQTPHGTVRIRYRLEPPVNPRGKFQGLTPDDVIYLIMVDRFTDGDTTNDHLASMPGTYDRSNPNAYHGGDLRGIRERLGYLRQLGVTTLWLTPIVANDPQSPQNYHGYGAVDEYAVNPHFGSLGDLQKLVTAAHRDRMKVLLDIVVNHVGPRDPWVTQSPEPDWFHGTLAHHTSARSPLQYLTDPHAPPLFWQDTVDGWFAGILPDLNQSNPDVGQYLLQVAIWWAEQTGVDGYRLDTFPFVPRRYWSRCSCALTRIFPHFFTVGEVFDSDPDVTSFFDGGKTQFDGIDTGISSVFDYPLYFSLHDVLLNGAPTEEIVRVLRHDALYARPQLLVTFIGNHDVPRFLTAAAGSIARLELADSIILTMRGIPQLYYGDEIGMTGGADPDNRHDFPGGFPGDPRNAFTAAGRTPVQQQIFAHLQLLLRLRRDHPALARGALWEIGWNRHWFAYARVDGSERLLAAFNAGQQAETLPLDLHATPLSGAKQLRPLLGGTAVAVQADKLEIALPPVGFRLYEVR